MTNEISDTAKRTYQERLKFLRKGQESYQAKDVSKAVQYYATYLKALADYFGIPETHLDPKYFDLQRDKAELLLVSQVYWDLCKAYDRSPGLQNECIRCLNQFVKFTIGFKHQHINAQLLKKYVRNNSAVNQQAFKGALSKIAVDSKKCFIATYAFGNDHIITKDLRIFKKEFLSRSGLGRDIIIDYYIFSPRLIKLLQANTILRKVTMRLIFRPIIRLAWVFELVRRKVC